MDRSQTDGVGGERAKSAARALGIIELLAETDRGFTFTELEQELELPKSSLHELLSVLVGHRFVELEPDRREYRLGIRVWESGQAYLRHHELVSEARSVMNRVASAVNETVQLAVLDDIDIVYLEKVDSSQPVRLASFVGKREPANTTALGKVLLAGLDDGTLVQRLTGRVLTGSTARTITTVAGLMEESQRVRSNGFALDDEEFAEGLRCLAVPIRGHQGSPIAALGVAVPMMRGDASQLATMLALLAGAALDVSRRLGCPAPILAQTAALKDRTTAEAAIEAGLARAEKAPAQA